MVLSDSTKSTCGFCMRAACCMFAHTEDTNHRNTETKLSLKFGYIDLIYLNDIFQITFLLHLWFPQFLVFVHLFSHLSSSQHGISFSFLPQRHFFFTISRHWVEYKWNLVNLFNLTIYKADQVNSTYWITVSKMASTLTFVHATVENFLAGVTASWNILGAWLLEFLNR